MILKRTLLILGAIALLMVVSCADSQPYCKGESCYRASLKEGKVGYRILLVGDAGAPSKPNSAEDSDQTPLFKALQDISNLLPSRTAVIFLGDLIYEAGLPGTEENSGSGGYCSSRSCAESRIDSQVDILSGSKAKGIFIPGNHDWSRERPDGWNRVKNLTQYIQESKRKKELDITLTPGDGCPGPSVVPLTGENVKVSVVALDTQWWLHKYEKPSVKNHANCEQWTEEGVLTSLKKQITKEKEKGRHVIVVAHHPIQSKGRHSGTIFIEDLKHPVKMFSQFIKVLKGEKAQEFSHPLYKKMRRNLGQVFREVVNDGDAPLIYAAGHDHNIQILEDEENGKKIFHLVSGNGSWWKASPVSHDSRTNFSFSNKATGAFILVDYLQSGKIRFVVLQPPGPGEVCQVKMEGACVAYSDWADSSEEDRDEAT